MHFRGLYLWWCKYLLNFRTEFTAMFLNAIKLYCMSICIYMQSSNSQFSTLKIMKLIRSTNFVKKGNNQINNLCKNPTWISIASRAIFAGKQHVLLLKKLLIMDTKNILLLCNTFRWNFYHGRLIKMSHNAFCCCLMHKFAPAFINRSFALFNPSLLCNHLCKKRTFAFDSEINTLKWDAT